MNPRTLQGCTTLIINRQSHLPATDDANGLVSPILQHTARHRCGLSKRQAQQYLIEASSRGIRVLFHLQPEPFRPKAEHIEDLSHRQELGNQRKRK